MHLWPSQTLSVRIARSLGDAYAFLSAPENFGKWASGLGASLERQGGVWIAQIQSHQRASISRHEIHRSQGFGFGVIL